MQYVICYDIADDARRSRVASSLLNFGTRIQESVFVANLDDELAERMRERLSKLVSEAEDRIHVFRLCSACESKTWVMGQGELVQDREFYII